MVIGIYGSIGCGKSTVAKIFKEEYDFNVIDADNIANSLIYEDKILNKINEKLNTEFNKYTKKNEFSNFFFEDSKKMKILQNIMWPYMEEIIRNRILENNNSIIDAAILYSAGWNNLCDYTIYVDINKRKIISRLKERKMSIEKIKSILEIQKEIIKQRKYASFIVYNNDSIKDLYLRVREIWKEIYH